MEYRYRIIDRAIAYQGFFTLSEYRLQHERFAGGWSDEISRLCFERGDAVAVLLWDPRRDAVVLVEQFRVGALGRPYSPWLYEIVAGITGPGETREEVARREAVEEAGCTIRELRPIGPILTTPGGSTETVGLYYGLVAAPPAGGLHGLDEEHEDIRVIVASPDEVWQWMDQGRIVNGPALTGLQWFRIHEKELRRSSSAPAD